MLTLVLAWGEFALLRRREPSNAAKRSSASTEPPSGSLDAFSTTTFARAMDLLGDRIIQAQLGREAI